MKTRMNWQKFERFSPQNLASESFDNDNKLTLKSFFVFCSAFFYKDQRRKDGNDLEKGTAWFPKYSSVTLTPYIKELKLTTLLLLTK